MAGRKHTDEATRFWEKVDRRGPDECWPWLAGTHKGYGTFRETGSRPGWKAQAPAVSYRLTYGQKPDEIDHLCCNTLCCNPTHLESVTHSENMRRIWQRGRGATKLTPEQIVTIRSDPRSGRKIASDYDVSPSRVWQIKRH